MKKALHHTAIALLLLSTPACAHAAEVNLNGVVGNRALVVIDGGKPRWIAVGENSPEGVKLMSVSGDSAVFEIAGRRETLTMGQGARVSAGSASTGARTVILTADARGHFFSAGAINGGSVRFLIDTEPHADHTTGHFVFSPPAVIIAAAGAGEAMKREGHEARNRKRMLDNPTMVDEFKGYRMITPHIEYQQKMNLSLGQRSFELIYLKGVHSEADTAVWLPRERVLFATAAVGVKRFPNIRPFLTIPDILASIKLMRALNPEIVIAGHGEPGTTTIFDDMEGYCALLLERVGQMVREGKSLEQIKVGLRMPEYDDWKAKDRLPSNVDAAYRAVTAAK